ncbi:hypothetical protein FRC08_014550 [Ceratobasidium sp. 394]|nr:hypothetical protein FRC08_014550 [Ceratobasidium sp. 394]
MLMALGELMGLSLVTYNAIESCLCMAATNTRPDNPLKSYTLPLHEQFVVWIEYVKTWFRTRSVVQELHLKELWPGWTTFSFLLAYFDE